MRPIIRLAFCAVLAHAWSCVRAQQTTYCTQLVDSLTAYGIAAMADGGVVVCGTWQGEDYNNDDIVAAKFDQNGTMLWGIRLDGGYGDKATAIKATPDGGTIIVGSGNSFGSPADAMVVKLDSDGQVTWARGIVNALDTYSADAVEPTSDGGYLVGGLALSGGTSNAFLIKLDPAGELQWGKRYHFTNEYLPITSIVQEAGGGFFVSLYAPTTYSQYVMRLTANGELVWRKQLLATAVAVALRPAGGYYVGGQHDENMYVAAIDTMGNMLWNTSIGTNGAEYGYSLAVATDGGAVVAGDQGSWSDRHLYLAKVAADGALQWTSVMGPGSVNSGTGIVRTADGGFAAVGSLGTQLGNPQFTGLGIYLAKTDELGVPCSACSYAQAGDAAVAVQMQDGVSPSISTGGVTYPITFDLLPLVAAEPVCLSTNDAPSGSPAHRSLRVQPNPLTERCELVLPSQWPMEGTELVIQDPLGRIIDRRAITRTPWELSRSDMSPGLYILHVVNAGSILGESVLVVQ